jgi:predicted DCC family thiol-disulfide oxidoreductase YuxK
MVETPHANPLPGVLLLYDGQCGLCHHLVRFVLSRDKAKVFYFASLQGEIAGQLLARHGMNADALSTVVLALDAGTAQERLLVRSAAVMETLLRLCGPWPALARVSSWLPTRMRDALYKWIARNRYRIFGRVGAADAGQTGSCPLPSAAHRDRFLGRFL